MTFLACMNFSEGSLLILLGVTLAVGMAVTGLVAALLSWLFKISAWKVLVSEAIFLSLVFGATSLLDVSAEGIQALSLLGAISCVALLAANGIFVLVRRRVIANDDHKYLSLNLSKLPELDDRPTEF